MPLEAISTSYTSDFPKSVLVE